MSSKVSRRKFVKTTAVAAAGVAASLASPRALGANDRVRIGFIGIANRGGKLIRWTLENKDAEIVAVCDVYKPFMERWANDLPGDIAQYNDYRKMLERKDIDAVFIVTPDHWHALQMIDACDAGKDIYVEKPLSITIHEGRRMVEAARRNKLVVQVGLHRRSSPTMAQLHELIRKGRIGKVTMAHCTRISNMYPYGIGKQPDSKPPDELDWNMWLGPRAWRPFNENIAPYKFRWWGDYSSQMANWGVHYCDAIRWMLDEEAPSAVSAHGGNFAIDDDRTIPDTMVATFEFASGRMLVFSQYEASGEKLLAEGDFDLRGTKGIAYVDPNAFIILPDTGQPFPLVKLSGVPSKDRQDKQEPIEPINVEQPDMDSGVLAKYHIQNFLDCIKSRKRPNCDIEDGHRSTTFAHLGNIALRTKSRLEWDPKAERFTNNEEANKLLHYKYRAPWKLG